MSFEEEEAFLKPFMEEAEKGKLIDVKEIKNAYLEKVGHSRPVRKSASLQIHIM